MKGTKKVLQKCLLIAILILLISSCSPILVPSDIPGVGGTDFGIGEGPPSYTILPFGLLYSDTSVPLTYNMNRTPNPGRKSRKLGIAQKNRLSEPITGLAITVEVNSNAIGDAIKEAKMDTIYYADLRTVSILAGLYQKKTVTVVGR